MGVIFPLAVCAGSVQFLHEASAPGVTRTPGTGIRNPLLYPPELRGHISMIHRISTIVLRVSHPSGKHKSRGDSSRHSILLTCPEGPRQDIFPVFRNHSVTGGHRLLSSAGKDSVVGLGARPGRAGSIGRDIPGHGEFTDLPSQQAGGASPCPIHGEISALWFPAEWTGPQTMGAPGNSVELFHLTVGTHPSLNGYRLSLFFVPQGQSRTSLVQGQPGSV